MATVAGKIVHHESRSDMLSGTPRAHAIDRWIFVFMASWFIAIVLTGFIPDAIMKVRMVETGQRPPFPLVLHMHAVAMGSFLLLLLAQSVLMATGRDKLHKQVGIAAFVLVPILVVIGLVLAPTIYHQVWNFAQAAPPAAQKELQGRLGALENILLLQIRVGLLFPLFLAIGLRARATDAGLHKRVMFLGTSVTLPAAIDRMEWLPTTLPASPVASDLWILVALCPLIVWDVARNRSLHVAYWIWTAVYLPCSLLLYRAWDTPWWHSTARALMGV